MKENEYQCEYCGDINQKGWSDEEAEREAIMIFGKHPDTWKEDKAVVCHNCFLKMHPLNHPDLLKEAKKNL